MTSCPTGPDFAFLEITHNRPDDICRSTLSIVRPTTLGLGEYAQTPNQSTIAAALEKALDEGTQTYSDDIELTSSMRA